MRIGESGDRGKCGFGLGGRGGMRGRGEGGGRGRVRGTGCLGVGKKGEGVG